MCQVVNIPINVSNRKNTHTLKLGKMKMMAMRASSKEWLKCRRIDTLSAKD